MSRRSHFDLRYTHEALAAPWIAPTPPGSNHADGCDLTARLLCLKALYDREREQRSGSLDPLSREH